MGLQKQGQSPAPMICNRLQKVMVGSVLVLSRLFCGELCPPNLQSRLKIWIIDDSEFGRRGPDRLGQHDLDSLDPIARAVIRLANDCNPWQLP